MEDTILASVVVLTWADVVLSRPQVSFRDIPDPYWIHSSTVQIELVVLTAAIVPANRHSRTLKHTIIVVVIMIGPRTEMAARISLQLLLIIMMATVVIVTILLTPPPLAFPAVDEKNRSSPSPLLSMVSLS